MFDIHTKSTLSRARTGTLRCEHGVIHTPAFVTVGTKATVKGLSSEDLEQVGTQCMFANTYHLVLSPGADIVRKHGGVHKMSGIDRPIITDSGGFQVFSLGKGVADEVSPVNTTYTTGQTEEFTNNQTPKLVKITEDGVAFRSHIDGTLHMFTPEYSIEAQHNIGADFIVAFDECVDKDASEKYIQKSLQRTHEWAERSLAAQKKLDTEDPLKYSQKMYGVVQGGLYKKYRQKSAEYIASLDFPCIALGGVSVGETTEELREEVEWMMDVLHEDPRPRHLLGISTFDDVIFAVQQGLDTFDCVLPTRDARTGWLYVPTDEEYLNTKGSGNGIETAKGHGNGIDAAEGHGNGIDAAEGQRTGIHKISRINITKSIFRDSLDLVNKEILGDVTYAYLHHLFKQRELLSYRLATMHNLAVMENFFAEIRSAVDDEKL